MQKDILNKYIISEVPSGIIENIINAYEDLKNKTNTFSDIIKNDNIYITHNTHKIFFDFLNLYNNINELIDTEKFIAETEDSFTGNEIIFWKKTMDYFQYCNSVKKKTKFLKEMNLEDFQDLVLYIFNNNVKYNNFINEYKSWSVDQVSITYKFINTILSEMLEEFHDLKTIVNDFNIRFGFEIEKYEYIWNLCEENKIYLMLKNIQEKLMQNDT